MSPDTAADTEVRPDRAWPMPDAGASPGHGQAAGTGSDAIAAPIASPAFATYRRLLLEWNTRFNLTAITDPAEVDRRLIADALRMLPAVDTFCPPSPPAGMRSPSPPRRLAASPPCRLIDIGAGAGFPGLPLKLARPELDVTLVEATGKKVSFLQQVIRELGLVGVEALHTRAEDLGHNPAFRGQYDLATARAVASLPALLELCVPFLRMGGHALFPKGAEIGEELARAGRAAPLVGARIVSADRLPGSDTRLVIVEKTGPTPTRYPRRAGIPAREPLGSIAR